MKETKIKIDDNVYNIQVAESEEEFLKGLKDVEKLPEDSGMLFPYDSEREVNFWMKDTLIPLDIIFIDEDFNVTKVTRGIPKDETLITGFAQYVLELNADSKVEIGDQVFLDCEDEDEDEAYILDSVGGVQTTIVGGERIFSRKNTITMIKMAKRAFRSKSDADFRSLGKKVFRYLEIQDNNEPEYVPLPK
ncbi:MAG: hypothetical protein Nk1A_9260 [Endomicrobiia bacterium]|nr:MAG: hypothetical protein Nk1A_9260 [Endomicrobiia bacterium]